MSSEMLLQQIRSTDMVIAEKVESNNLVGTSASLIWKTTNIQTIRLAYGIYMLGQHIFAM